MVSAATESGMARLDLFTAGSTFGEVAFIDRSPRSANVTAINTVECRVLTRPVFEQLGLTAPALKYRLMESLAISMAGTVRHINRELAFLK
jgi:CRP-like cAMP-binding protein